MYKCLTTMVRMVQLEPISCHLFKDIISFMFCYFLRDLHIPVFLSFSTMLYLWSSFFHFMFMLQLSIPVKDLLQGKDVSIKVVGESVTSSYYTNPVV